MGEVATDGLDRDVAAHQSSHRARRRAGGIHDGVGAQIALRMPDHEAGFDRAHAGTGEDRGALSAGIGQERRDQTRRVEEAVARVERPAADPLRPDERDHRRDLGRLEPPGLHAEPALELGGLAQPAFARLRPRQHQVARLMEAQPSDGPFERLQPDDREPREGDVDLRRELRPDAAVGER